MIHIRENADIHPDFDFELVAARESFLFFDIETTGFTAGRGYIYLIGTVSYEDGSWVLNQYFAENFIEEEKILRSFSDMIYQKEKNGIVYTVSYNGEGFDIPFIKKSLLQYSLPNCFADTVSIDLLRKLRPYKRLTGLESLSLKSVCAYAGICREDSFSGGELISVYEQYVRMLENLPSDNTAAGNDAGHINQYTENATISTANGDLRQSDAAYGRDALLRKLLLHNAEDVMNLPMLMGILAYDIMFDGEFRYIRAALSEDTLNISADLKAMPLKSMNWEWEGVKISIVNEEDEDINAEICENINAGASENLNAGACENINAGAGENLNAGVCENINAGVGEDLNAETSADCAGRGKLIIRVPVYEGELKYFYADYKQYFYLPKEDMAIHKSVGIYTEKKSRRQATARTCYQRKQGIYIPQPEAVFAPAFYKDYKTKPMYGDIKKYLNEKNEITDIDITLRYIIAVLDVLLDKLWTK